MPAASRWPNGSLAASAIENPAQAIAANPATTSERAEQPELLADDREDQVGVRLGQVAELLHALAEPDAGQPARAEAHRRDCTIW